MSDKINSHIFIKRSNMAGKETILQNLTWFEK